MNAFVELGLWQEEEARIHDCVSQALKNLIDTDSINSDDNELHISGQLRPYIQKCLRSLPGWIFLPETSVFQQETDEIPTGHPDLHFARWDISGQQINYHVEAKRVRERDASSSMNHPKYYVTNGIKRYSSGLYCKDLPSGAIVGYVQNSEFDMLLELINKYANDTGEPEITLQGTWQNRGISYLNHVLTREEDQPFHLSHIWGDFRPK